MRGWERYSKVDWRREEEDKGDEREEKDWR